jgi:hypothetical protein
MVDVATGPVFAALHFPADYLRSTDPRLYLKVVSVLTEDLTHPNVFGTVVCLGSGFAPGTPISALLWELYEILTYQNVTLDESNALSPEACRLLRAYRGLLDQLSPKPPMRRQHKLRIKVSSV